MLLRPARLAATAHLNVAQVLVEVKVGLAAGTKEVTVDRVPELAIAHVAAVEVLAALRFTTRARENRGALAGGGGGVLAAIKPVGGQLLHAPLVLLAQKVTVAILL